MNYLQGYRLRRTLADVKADIPRVVVGQTGMWMRATFREELMHKLDVMYLHYQNWTDIADVLGCCQQFMVRLRQNLSTPSRAFMARLDTEYRVAWHQVEANIAANRRADEGSPQLTRWREKRKQHNVGYRNTKRAKRESGRSQRPTKKRTVS
jgi:hypothetical protein